jgi:hypothetical protein
LENHQAALDYTAAQEYARKAEAAQLHLERICAETERLQGACAQLPTQDMLLQKLSQLQQLRDQKEALQMQAQMQPAIPTAPEPPAPFRGCTGEMAREQARQDQVLYRQLHAGNKKPAVWPMPVGAVLILLGIVCMMLPLLIPAVLLIALGGGSLIGGVVLWRTVNRKNKETWAQIERLLARYQPLDVDQWEDAARRYALAQQNYEAEMTARRSEQTLLQEQMQTVNARLLALTEGASYIQKEQAWKTALEQHKALADSLREQRRVEEMIRSLSTDRELPQQPAFADSLTFTQPETARLLADAKFEQHQLQRKLGHCQGQMEALGLEEPLHQQLEAVNARLVRLEDTYKALEIAQMTLQEASKELQRRFAPRISRRTQELFGKMTVNRYDRLKLGEDLSLSAGARGEDTLHEALWRSDGTMDQLYLALRLAVAEELTPQSPLILDDALVRFDDTRLASALEILEDCAETRQVILFTCQSREASLQKGKNTNAAHMLDR